MTTPTPRRDFIDRVMLTVETDPRPSATRSFARALQDRSPEDAVASLAVAWRLAAHARSVPTVIRVQALALVAIVALASGAAVTAAAGAAYQVAVPLVRSVAVERMDVRSVPSIAPAPAATIEPAAATIEDVPGADWDRRTDYDDADRAPLPPLERTTPTVDGDGEIGDRDNDQGQDSDDDAAPTDREDDANGRPATGPDEPDEADEDAAEADDGDADEHGDTDDSGPDETDEPDAGDEPDEVDAPDDDGDAESSPEPDGDD